MMCSRKGCMHPAMYFIPKIGKLCEDCKNEFIYNFAKTPDTDERILDILDVFCSTSKEKEISQKAYNIRFFKAYKIIKTT